MNFGSQPFTLNADQAAAANYIFVRVFGRNNDVDLATFPEDLWRAGGVFVPPTVTRTHAVKSTSANDTSAGTGARTVKVYGINSTYDLASETITMNGTTNVNTAATYIHIYKIEALTFGSGGVSAGNITATAATDATVTDFLPTGFNISANGVYFVPAGYTAHILRFNAVLQSSSSSGAQATVQLKTQDFGGSFVVQKELTLDRADSRIRAYEFTPPLRLDEKTFIKLTASEVSVNNCDISGSIDLVLIAN